MSKITDLFNMNLVTPLMLSKSGNEVANHAEVTRFRRSIGQLPFIARKSHTILQRLASSMAAKSKAILVHRLKDLAAMIKYAINKAPVATIRSVSEKKKTNNSFSIDVYPDGAMVTQKKGTARGRYIMFRRCGEIFNPIFWASRRLRRVARSSGTAEIIAEVYSMNKSAINLCFNEVN